MDAGSNPSHLYLICPFFLDSNNTAAEIQNKPSLLHPSITFDRSSIVKRPLMP